MPFVQYFTEGFALHGAYWHDDFGTPRSHGCVNLAPVDAAWLFRFTDPEVPAACALVNHMYQRRAAVPGPAGYRLPGQARAVVADLVHRAYRGPKVLVARMRMTRTRTGRAAIVDLSVGVVRLSGVGGRA